jgi:uncharacterized protein (DUF2267 family)
MDYQDVVRMLQQVTGLPAEQAERSACTGLRTLAGRISKGEVEDLIPRLPEPLRPCLHHEGPRERYKLDEFLQRLTQDLGNDRATAEKVAKAVFAVLWRATGAKEYHDLASELPGDFQPLLDEAIGLASAPPFEAELPPARFTLDEFLDRIVRNGVDRDRARAAAEAVLMVLAMRITGGQVEDLIPLVPGELRVWLRRGVSRTGGRGSRMSLEEFLDEIAGRIRGSRDEAAEQARAVLAALRELVGDKEFADTVSQLPREYREALLQEQLS